MSIEVMRQALEYTKPGAFVPVDMHTTKLLVDALRAAIEQAEKQGQHWCTYCRGNNAHNCQFNTTIPRVHTYVTNTTAPAPRQEQYDQTALELCKECGWRAMIPGDGCLVCARQKAPRQWVGLTEEEVNDCIKLPNRNLFARDGTTSQRIARAIEAKLKEKNDVLRSV